MIRKFINKIHSHIYGQIIIIYQMGKVGSTSLQKSLELLNIECIHLHSIYKQIRNSLIKNSQKALRCFEIMEDIKYRCRWYKKLFLRRKNKNLKIISMVREPIARNISFYFQNLPYFLLSLDIDKKHDTRLVEHTNIDALISIFFEEFNHDHGVNWFDEELRKAFGLDIYNYPFDKKKGYTTFKHKNIDVMVLQMEKMNQLQKEIGNFLSIDDFKLINENESSKKWYSCVYKQFNEEIEFSIDYIDSLYNSKFMRHFYSNGDIERFRAKYTTKQSLRNECKKNLKK